MGLLLKIIHATKPNRIRNVLHFNHKSELSVSKKRVTDLIEINRFVDDAVAKIVK